MTILFTAWASLAVVFTAWLTYENYVFTRPHSRAYFVSILFYGLLCFPIALPIELTSGPLGERIRDAYDAARRKTNAFENTGKKKLIG